MRSDASVRRRVLLVFPEGRDPSLPWAPAFAGVTGLLSESCEWVQTLAPASAVLAIRTAGPEIEPAIPAAPPAIGVVRGLLVAPDRGMGTLRRISTRESPAPIAAEPGRRDAPLRSNPKRRD